MGSERLKSKRKYDNTVIGKRFNTYKSNARRYGRSFELTYEQFKNLITQECKYCGATGNVVKMQYGSFVYSARINGIDRVSPVPYENA